VAFLDGDAYLRFMGRFSIPLATVFADWSELPASGTVLDVGCGPGVLTEVLVSRFGGQHVLAVDPSPAFVAAAREHVPGVDIQQGVAERLPYDDDSVDAAVAQLVVHFMADPVAGLAEMRRVTRPGGVVSACVWDHAGGGGPLSVFWSAVRSLGDPVEDESRRAGVREGHLAELLGAAGLSDVRSDRIDVTVGFPSFEDWWEPYTMGVGPAGDHVASLDHAGREQLVAECRARLPEAPFELTASAWAARAEVTSR
jgi:SAM-dependent methyltransferase